MKIIDFMVGMRLFSFSGYALTNNEIMKNTKYSKRIDNGDSKVEAEKFLEEVIKISSKDNVHLFSFDNNRVEVIAVNLDVNPTSDLVFKVPSVIDQKNQKSFEERIKIKNHYAFIDYHLIGISRLDEINSSNRIKVILDYSHPSIDNYKIYFKEGSDRNIIECPNARIELKRYEFYKIVKNMFSFFASEITAYSRIEFKSLLFHFFDTSLPVMYSSLLKSMSVLTGKSVFDLDIEYKGMLSNYKNIKKRIVKIQLVIRNQEKRSDKYSNFKLINERINLTTQDVVTYVVLWTEGINRNYIEELFSEASSYCAINESEYFDKAIIFYDGYSRKILGLNYDSAQGIVRDQNDSLVGMNAEKYNAINELFRINSPNFA